MVRAHRKHKCDRSKDFFYVYTLIGDANKDCIVKIFDGTIIGTAWNSKPGDSSWDPRADLKKDEVIDLYDITIWGEHFGESA